MAHSEEDLAWIMKRFKTTREDALTAPAGLRSALVEWDAPIVATPQEIAHGQRLAARLVAYHT